MRTANDRAPSHKRRRNLGRVSLAVPAVLTLTGAALIGIPNAQAAEAANLQVLITPAAAAVGDTGIPIEVNVGNVSTMGESLTITSIRIAPSCDATGTAATPCTPANANPGIFTLGPATGGVACAARTFTVGAPDASGVSTITPDAPVVLVANDTCQIKFSATAANVPTPNLTHFNAAASLIGPAAVAIPVYAEDTITISQDAANTITSVSELVSPNQVRDNATVTGRTNAVAGGTMQFALYSSNTCTDPAVYLSGPVAVPAADTAVQSPVFSPATAGTYYWRVFYSGDQNNAASSSACGAPGEVVTTTAAGTGQPVNGGGNGGGGNGGNGGGGGSNGPDGDTCNGLAVTTNQGGSGNDDVVGTAGDDVVNLGSGNDTFVGNGGNDTVCGGSGNDEITTGSGNDYIDAGSGDDVIHHGTGTDDVNDGSGTDTVAV